MYTMVKLRQLRKANNYTIYDMARMLAISPSYYSQIENNKKRLFYDMAIKIATIFSMEPDDIFIPMIRRY